jgi:hypothetical protein
VKEHLLDMDLEREHRPVPLDHEVVEPRRVADHTRSAVDAEGVGAAWDDEQEGDMGVRQNVHVAVGAPVAGTLGDDEGVLVEHVSQAAGSPFGEASTVPSAFEVATTQNGDAAIHCRCRGRRLGLTLSTPAGSGTR